MSKQESRLGLGIALGAGIGVLLYGVTENPAWIAIGTASGVALGASLNQVK
jgi:hypothetical protein